MRDQTDLFGNPAGANQLNLFGEGENRLQAPEQPKLDHAARAREKLEALIERARRAQTMPWSDRDVRMWETVFPQMANWLPEEEARQMVLEFDQQIARLKAA